MAIVEWETRVTNQFLIWIGTLEEQRRAQVVDAIDRLAEAGPTLGRPLVDSIAGSSVRNLKELRPCSAGRTEVRVLFAFAPWRPEILVMGGDNSGRWRGWYRRAIPHAEELYAEYFKELEAERDDD